MFEKFSVALVGAALVSSAAVAAPQKYRLVKLAPLAGSTTTVARAISANGSIAGEAQTDPQSSFNTPANFGKASALASVFTGVPAGSENSFTRGVNDSGIAAGTAQNQTANTSRAILTGTGGFTELAPLAGFANAGAAGINNGGTVVGYSMSVGIFAAEGTARPIATGQGTQTATVWDTAGVATALANPFGNFNSLATAINASGQIIGVANRGTSTATGNATIWNGGVGTALSTDAGKRSTARGISSDGWVAGRQDDLSVGTFQGSVWAAGGGQFNLGPLAGCDSSDLRGINAGRTAVGFSQNGACTGVVGGLWDWNGAGYDGYEINSLVVNLGGWDLYAPQGINDAGQIVGFGFDEFGVNRGWLLTAVPEPGTWAMLIGGFGLVGGAARRQRRLAAA
jgi:uncharacterized membrane protein